MDVTAFLVVLLAAVARNADAALTWKSPLTSGGTITRNITEGTTVFKPTLIISASTNAAKNTVTYSVTSTGQGPFQIDKNNGQITLTKALDFETQPNTYTLTVTATEVLPTRITTPTPTSPTTTKPTTTAPTTTTTASADTPIVSDTVTVTINVMDVPTFAMKKGSVCVPDGAKAGDEVTTLPIEDKVNDSPVSYLMTGPGNDNFTVDATGKVTVATGKNIFKGHGDSLTLTIKRSQTEAFTLTVTVGDCSAASPLAPLSLLMLLMVLVVSMN